MKVLISGTETVKKAGLMLGGEDTFEEFLYNFFPANVFSEMWRYANDYEKERYEVTIVMTEQGYTFIRNVATKIQNYYNICEKSASRDSKVKLSDFKLKGDFHSINKK